MYNEKIMKRFKQPINAGEIKNPDTEGEVGNMKCGDIMKLTLKIQNNRIEDIKFQTYGCVTAIASTDFLCDIAKGKTLEEAEKITSQDVLKEMGEVPTIKKHCSVLAQNALKKAIQKYKEKNKNN